MIRLSVWTPLPFNEYRTHRTDSRNLASTWFVDFVSPKQALACLYPDKALVEGSHDPFDPQEYARAGHCTLNIRQTPYPQLSGEWRGRQAGLFYHTQNLWYEVEWEGQNLDVVWVSWEMGMGNLGSRHFVLADSEELAEAFINAVCIWNTELRDEVLV